MLLCMALSFAVLQGVLMFVTYVSYIGELTVWKKNEKKYEKLSRSYGITNLYAGSYESD